jgi:uncharacterized protein (DUF1330 family)
MTFFERKVVMPKAYIISRINVRDAEAYGRYTAVASVAMKKYGARVLARGGRCEARAQRIGAADFEMTLVEGA